MTAYLIVTHIGLQKNLQILNKTSNAGFVEERVSRNYKKLTEDFDTAPSDSLSAPCHYCNFSGIPPTFLRSRHLFTFIHLINDNDNSD